VIPVLIIVEQSHGDPKKLRIDKDRDKDQDKELRGETYILYPTPETINIQPKTYNLQSRPQATEAAET